MEATKERPIIECDLNGIPFSQRSLDFIYSRVQSAISNHPDRTVDILIKRVPSNQTFPRLIADNNDIYEALSELLRQRKETIT